MIIKLHNRKVYGFQTIVIEFTRKTRKNFKPIDIIHNPAKKTLCYYSSDISKAYYNTHSIHDSDKLKHGFAYECYYCSKCFTRPDRHKKHKENCA